jgi:F-box protein 11
MNRCEIKGHKDKETVGILVKNGNAIIKDSKIHHFKLTGINVLGDVYNNVKVVNC